MEQVVTGDIHVTRSDGEEKDELFNQEMKVWNNWKG